MLFLTALAVIAFGLTGCEAPARPSPDFIGIEIPKAAPTEPSVVEITKAELIDPRVVEVACELIYQGKFNAAGELIQRQLGASGSTELTVEVPSSTGAGQFSQDAHTRSGFLAELANIIDEYNGISQRRQLAREAVYAEGLDELEKLRVAADTNDVNDVNDISKALSVITRACEFADEQQRSELLSKPFVKGTIQKAKTRAAEFESNGKWFDAHMIYYYWLQMIEPDNEAYSDYGKQLIEKANIAASFQDSPCETRKQRYKGVKKDMFIWSIDVLNRDYVSIVDLDYRRMASKAIRRCKLLSEVMDHDSSLVPWDTNESRVTSHERQAWLGGLAVILDELNQSPIGVNKDKFIDVFEKVLALNTATIELPQQLLIAQFAEAALSELDPYTVIVWPRQIPDFEKEMSNEFTGIGIEISREKGLLTVVSLLPDTPAYNSGLDAGDVIEAVDGVETKDMTLICAVRRITGPAGTEVTLMVRRPGQQQTCDITITRARIIVPTIRGWQRTEAGKWRYMIDDQYKIGYVRITNFSAETASNLEKVLRRLQAEGLKGLILDLRFNSGGLLNSAVEIADKFIKEGLIVSTRPRFGVWTYSLAHKKKTLPDYPLVVLINRFSASGSEIVAGALQDPKHKRAVLVGDRTHGKGSVQGIVRYPGADTQLKYTMAYYHLPSGQRVKSRDAAEKQGSKNWGVGPNIEVKLRNDELKKMRDVRRDNSVLVKADHDKGSAPLKKHTAEETLMADTQLAIGVLVVKSKLIRADFLLTSTN